ncbi:hypothetical protein PAEPH01_0431 [Pancytospora epiphaga]|nr:hypothetical protein PAEPH01_0431 [Pancytospora epiphaga]
MIPVMNYPSLNEARKYSEELPPSKCSIFKNGSTLYSNFKTLVLRHEHTIPQFSGVRYGILQQLSMLWYSTQSTLHLYSYDTFTTETISSSFSEVYDVRCFEPVPGIFNKNIIFCLLVVTKTELIIYAVDNNSLVATDFTSRLPSPVTCIDIVSGLIFVGCENGRVYQVAYRALDLLSYRYMSIHSADSFISSICSVFGRKVAPITSISASKTHLVAVGEYITVYRTDAGFTRKYRVPCTEDYVKVQIVEDSPLLFYCICKGGRRDFFDTSKLFSKDFPVSGSLFQDRSDDLPTRNERFITSPTMLLSYKPNSTCHSVFVTFNEDQLRNFSRIRPIENFELFHARTPIFSVSISDSLCVVFGDRKLSCYDILDSKAFLLECRPQEIRTIYKNYGDIEFMVRYYELLAAGKDVSRLEGVCKNGNAAEHALFIYIYNVIKPIFYTKICEVFVSEDSNSKIYFGEEIIPDTLERVTSKLKMLRNKIPQAFSEAKKFVDEFIQTNFYVTLLHNYGIPVKESMENIMLYGDDFKANSLKALLSAVSVNQSIEPLIKTMRDSCPSYLPLDQVNYQRGSELLEKEGAVFLAQSLECFKNTHFDKSIINKYNERGFYSGSVTLLRDKFNFSYEVAIPMLKNSVKCKGAMNAGLCSNNEAFLYPFFEVLLDLEHFIPCKCCDVYDMAVDFLSIENPIFPVFLREQSLKTEKACNLYWKYLLYRGKKSDAVRAIVEACGSDFTFDTKVKMLELALTIASGIGPKSPEARYDWYGRVNMMLKLSRIQAELAARDSALKTNQLHSADTLYNDYCYEYPDLAIKILDVLGHDNKKILRELYLRAFLDMQFIECLAFLRDISRKDLSIVIDLLIEKSTDRSIICKQFLDCGFGQGEIVLQVKAYMERPIHPGIREELQKGLEMFTNVQRPMSTEEVKWNSIHI